MSLCLSVRNKGVGFYLPSLGEGLGVGGLVQAGAAGHGGFKILILGSGG